MEGYELGIDIRDVPIVVFDTNVIESALRSRRGASFALLSMAGKGWFEIAVSVPLVCEYQDVLMRQVARGAREESTVTDVLDYLCSIAKRQSIFFLWRPWLTDPKDDMILELAVAAQVPRTGAGLAWAVAGGPVQQAELRPV